MKIYTKTGDAGMTGLYGGGRVSKDDARINAYGSVDELNALLGLLRTSHTDAETLGVLLQIQRDLFSVGAELATVEPSKLGVRWNAAEPTAALERTIDAWQEQLPPLRNFILPGGTLAAAQCHVARTVCRRCERDVVRFAQVDPQADAAHIIVYLNRLSDLLFVMARRLNHISGVPDVEWTGRGEGA